MHKTRVGLKMYGNLSLSYPPPTNTHSHRATNAHILFYWCWVLLPTADSSFFLIHSCSAIPAQSELSSPHVCVCLCALKHTLLHQPGSPSRFRSLLLKCCDSVNRLRLCNYEQEPADVLQFQLPADAPTFPLCHCVNLINIVERICAGAPFNAYSHV